MPPKFKFDQCFVVMSIVYKFHNIWLRKLKLDNGNVKKKEAIFTFVKEHNSRQVKVTPPKFKLDLCFVVISIA